MRIIFICHEATRTGVPLLLLQLAKWLKTTYNAKIFVILLTGGPLECEFRLVSNVLTWNTKAKSGAGLSSKAITRLRNVFHNIFRRYRLINRLRSFHPDIVYANTVAASKFFHKHIDLFRPYTKVLHCHEMPFTISRYVPKEVREVFLLMDKIIVVNTIIEKYFLDLGIDPKKILKVSEYFCNPMPETTSAPSGTVFNVTSAGLGSWRKGIDIFIQSAFYFSKIYQQPFRFTWIGQIPTPTLKQLEYEISKCGLTDRFYFVGEVTDLSEYLMKADVFFLSSREDSYPIVMMEAAWFGKPVMYFDQTGGSGELVNDATMAIAPFDAYEAANRLKFLAENPEIRKLKGSELHKKIQKHTVEFIGQKIFDFIKPLRKGD